MQPKVESMVIAVDSRYNTIPGQPISALRHFVPTELLLVHFVFTSYTDNSSCRESTVKLVKNLTVSCGSHNGKWVKAFLHLPFIRINPSNNSVPSLASVISAILILDARLHRG